MVCPGASDGNYTFLVECVVVSKLLAKVLEKGMTESDLLLESGIVVGSGDS